MSRGRATATGPVGFGASPTSEAVSPDALAGLGAFLSGAGSVLGAWLVLKSERKRMNRECEERLRQYKEGIEMAEKIEHPERK